MKIDKIKWLRLELTNNCNFDCSYCTEQFMARKKGFMDIALAKKIIDEVSLTKISDVIGFQFMGEGLLHPKFSEILSYACEKGVNCKLVTNGSLLTDKIIGSILKFKLQDIYISYFTPDEYSYEGRKSKNINYEEYKQRIKNLISRKIENKSNLKITIGLLNTRYCFLPGIRGIDDNTGICNEIISWIQYVEDIGGKNGALCREHDLKVLKNTRDFLENWTYALNDDINITVIEVSMWANQLLIKNGIKVKKSLNGYCESPFKQLFVSWDGTCSCCCLDYDCAIKLGDANKESIAGIWNGERYNTIRENINKNVLIEPYCQVCRGKIDFCSFMFKVNKSKLLKMIFNRSKLLYLLGRGLKRFKVFK